MGGVHRLGLPMPAECRELLIVQRLPVGRVVPHAADAVLARENKAVRAARAGNGGGVHLDDRPVKHVVVGSLHECYRLAVHDGLRLAVAAPGSTTSLRSRQRSHAEPPVGSADASDAVRASLTDCVFAVRIQRASTQVDVGGR